MNAYQDSQFQLNSKYSFIQPKLFQNFKNYSNFNIFQGSALFQ